MQTKNSKKNQQHRWSQIVELVEGANLKEVISTKMQEINRKKAYRYELDKQIQQNYTHKIMEEKRKLRERTELEEKIVQERNSKAMDKYEKMKTQQKYGRQNLQLATVHKKNSIQTAQYPQNPFVSLADKQDLRNKQTKLSFQLQNKINDLQMNLLRSKSLQDRKEEEKIKKELENYAQNVENRKMRDRQNFKNKYLSIKKSQGELMNFSTTQSVQKNYVKFLNHQIQELKNKRYREKQVIDESISVINKHAEIPDSSPAYLGRFPYSSDRKKQLDILDSATFGRNNVKNIRAGSEMNRSLGFEQMSMSLDAKTVFENQRRKIFGNNKVLPPISKFAAQSQLQLEKPTLFKKQSYPLSSWTKSNPQQCKSAIQLNSCKTNLVQQPQRERKSYSQYNFITGEHKTFFI